MGNSSSNVQLSQEEFEKMKELVTLAKQQQEQIKELTIKKHTLESYLAHRYNDFTWSILDKY